MSTKDQVLFKGPIGGTVSLVGPRIIHASYPHRLPTFLLLIPAISFPLFFILFPGVSMFVLNKEPTLLIGVVLLGALAIFPAAISNRRSQSMGTIILDADEGSLERVNGKDQETWPIEDVVGFSKRRDNFHRITPAYWLSAELKDGRTLRLGKGKADEVDQVLNLMRDWGLPVR